MTTSFLDLPGELRNYVYELYADDYSKPDTLILYDKHYLPPPLARVSRQIREEILSVWDAVPWDITWRCDLEVCVKNLDLEFLATFFNGKMEVPEYIETIRITFLFTDASKISENVAAAQKWSAVDFACWNDVDYADPEVTITADFDWKSFEALGVPTAPRRQAKFNAQPTFLEEIVRRAKDVKWGQRLGQGLRERVFRQWLMSQVCGQGESNRRTARTNEAKVNGQGMKRKRLQEDQDGVEETWDEW